MTHRTTQTAVAAALALMAGCANAIEYVPTPYPIVGSSDFGLLETRDELVVCFDTDQGPLCGALNMAMFKLCELTPQHSMLCPDT